MSFFIFCHDRILRPHFFFVFFSKATKVQWRFTEEGQRIRVSLRSGRIIPLSKIAEDETEDMVMKSAYTGGWWEQLIAKKLSSQITRIAVTHQNMFTCKHNHSSIVVKKQKQPQHHLTAIHPAKCWVRWEGGDIKRVLWSIWLCYHL